MPSRRTPSRCSRAGRAHPRRKSWSAGRGAVGRCVRSVEEIVRVNARRIRWKRRDGVMNPTRGAFSASTSRKNSLVAIAALLACWTELEIAERAGVKSRRPATDTSGFLALAAHVEPKGWYQVQSSPITVRDRALRRTCRRRGWSRTCVPEMRPFFSVLTGERWGENERSGKSGN